MLTAWLHLDSSLAISHDLLLGCDSKALKKTVHEKAFQLPRVTKFLQLILTQFFQGLTDTAAMIIVHKHLPHLGDPD